MQGGAGEPSHAPSRYICREGGAGEPSHAASRYICREGGGEQVSLVMHQADIYM